MPTAIDMALAAHRALIVRHAVLSTAARTHFRHNFTGRSLRGADNDAASLTPFHHSETADV